MSLVLAVGRVYRAKKPANCGGFFNDRLILWLGAGEVQYDGPAVAMGRRYPRVSIAQFMEWAAEDVTDQLPDGKYAPYPR